MKPVVQVLYAVSEAKDTFLSLVPRGQERILDDPEVTSFGLQSHLSLLLSDCRRKALLALPAQDRVVEVITSAAEGSISSSKAPGPKDVPSGMYLQAQIPTLR
jgi:hypothetical protein